MFTSRHIKINQYTLIIIILIIIIVYSFYHPFTGYKKKERKIMIFHRVYEFLNVSPHVWVEISMHNLQLLCLLTTSEYLGISSVFILLTYFRTKQLFLSLLLYADGQTCDLLPSVECTCLRDWYSEMGWGRRWQCVRPIVLVQLAAGYIVVG